MLAVVTHGGYKAGNSCARSQYRIETVCLYSLRIDGFSFCIRIIFSAKVVLDRLNLGQMK